MSNTLPPFLSHYFEQVNNNGIISFDVSYSAFQPNAFPFSSTPIVAPFWADSDTRMNGNVWYGERSDDVLLLLRAQEDVQSYFSSQYNFEPNFLFVATWDSVHHYQDGTKVSCTYILAFFNYLRSSYHSYFHIFPSSEFKTYNLCIIGRLRKVLAL